MNINITFKNTLNDFIDCIYYFEKYLKPPKKFYLYYIFMPILGIFFSIIDIITTNYFSIFDLVVLIFFLVFFIFSSAIYNYNLYKRTKKILINYKNINENIKNEKNLIIQSDHLIFNIINNPSSEKKIYFKDISKLIIDKNRIFIYVNADLTIIIPISQFKDSTEKDLFLNTILTSNNNSIIINRTRYFN